MNLNEIADVICGKLNQAGNIPLRERFKSEIKAMRALLIRRDIERNNISSQYLQTYQAKLKIVDALDTCAATIGCPVLRTVNRMPETIRLNSDSDFKFVGDLNGGTWIETEPEELQFTKYNRFTSDAIRFAVKNNYFYVFNNIKLKFVKLEAAFENPQEAINFCDDSECYKDEHEFPCPADMVDTIMDTIYRREVGVEKEMNETKVE